MKKIILVLVVYFFVAGCMSNEEAYRKIKNTFPTKDLYTDDNGTFLIKVDEKTFIYGTNNDTDIHYVPLRRINWFE